MGRCVWEKFCNNMDLENHLSIRLKLGTHQGNLRRSEPFQGLPSRYWLPFSTQTNRTIWYRYIPLTSVLLLYLFIKLRIAYRLKNTTFPVQFTKAYWRVQINLRSYNFVNRYGSGQIHGLPFLFLRKELPVSMEAGKFLEPVWIHWRWGMYVVYSWNGWLSHFWWQMCTGH